jgi:hypothetical protein
MPHHDLNRVTVIALLVIGVVMLSAIGISFPGRFTHSGTTTTTVTINPSAVPFNSSVYLSSQVGSCKGPSGYGPCFGGNFSQAEVFNCASAAASTSGCVWRVASPSNPQLSYQITIWYPYAGHANEPLWANCIFTHSGDPGRYYGAYCISISSTGFIVTEPSPPPL